MKLSLAPIQYYWDRGTVFDYYREVEDLPVDIVYLGETVCSKRRALRPEDWLEIGERLAATGKEVVLSTLTLIESESEVSAMRRVIENGRFAVEANDLGAVNMAHGQRFVSGPHINIYNPEALALMAETGACRWVVPFELSRTMLEMILAARPAGIETEMLAFGRLPLAFSARCFTARAYNLSKDDCGFRCRDYPEGMPLQTQEQKSFLTVNGIQVQSASVYSLLGETEDLRALGVDVLRLAPLPRATAQVIRSFRSVLDGRQAPAEAGAQIARLAQVDLCDGYWHGLPGMNQSRYAAG
ncbi:MAG: U32 family peptidase [Pseudomonadota bacterium]